MNDTAVRERAPVAAVVDERTRARWWVPVVVFAVVAVVLWAVAALSAAHLPRTDDYTPAPEHFVGGALFEPWARWDAAWYRTIALDGYEYYPGVQSSVAFWPSYPLVLRALDPATPSPYVAGSLVTLASGLAAAVGFHAWCRRWFDVRTAATALGLLVLFPFAWYLYGPVYADALCLAAMVGAFLALEKDRLWLAGVLGLIGATARPIGIVFAVALCLRLVERRNLARARARSQQEPQPLAPDAAHAIVPDGAVVPEPPLGVRLVGRGVERARALGREAVARFWPRGLHWSDAPVLLAAAGIVAWCGYLWLAFGDPLLWQEIQSVPGWDQGSGPPTWFKVFLLEQLVHDAGSPFTWSKLAQGVAAVGMLLLVPRIGRRFGWAYAAFTAGVVLVPLVGTKDFMGTGRYLLAAFPVYAVAGEWLAARPRARALTFVASGCLLVFLTTLFARGHYLA